MQHLRNTSAVRTSAVVITLAITLAITLLAPASGVARPTGRIINGTAVTPERGASMWPFLVSIGLQGQSAKDSHFCGGAILDQYRILTAAHCMEDEEKSGTFRNIPSTVSVLAGVTTLSQSGGGQRIQVRDAFVHGGWIDDHDGQDIAILRLAGPLTFNDHVQPIQPIAPEHDSWWGNGAGVAASPTTGPWAAGWGNTIPWDTGDNYPDQLNEVSFPIVPDSVCMADAAPGLGIIPNLDFCGGVLDSDATGTNGSTGLDTCQGDSGGPLVVGDGAGNWEEAGIVSFGDLCAATTYGAYTRIASLRSWIASVSPTANQGPGAIKPVTSVKQIGATSGTATIRWGAAFGGAVEYTIYAQYRGGLMKAELTTRKRVAVLHNMAPNSYFSYYIAARNGGGNEAPLKRFSVHTSR